MERVMMMIMIIIIILNLADQITESKNLCLSFVFQIEHLLNSFGSITITITFIITSFEEVKARERFFCFCSSLDCTILIVQFCLLLRNPLFQRIFFYKLSVRWGNDEKNWEISLMKKDREERLTIDWRTDWMTDTFFNHRAEWNVWWVSLSLSVSLRTS